MAEDQEKKDEEKFELAAEGEALGYIGMDQAQVRAMQVATETPADYGPAYFGTPMAFEVVSAQETEDHYVITLSLRPQGDFSGRSGQEQLFIEKEGGVAHRQVLAFPRPGRRSCFIVDGDAYFHHPDTASGSHRGSASSPAQRGRAYTHANRHAFAHTNRHAFAHTNRNTGPNTTTDSYCRAYSLSHPNTRPNSQTLPSGWQDRLLLRP